MNAEFNWWLLIVGLVGGAGLVWLVIADWSRREEDVSQDERIAESAWIAQALRERGDDVDPAAAEEVLALHRVYLRRTGALDAADADPEDRDSVDADPMDVDGGLDGTGAAAGDADETRGARDWATDTDDEAVDAPVNGRRAAAAALHHDAREPDRSDDRAVRPDTARGSVRSTRMSPRGGPPAGLESEPPA